MIPKLFASWRSRIGRTKGIRRGIWIVAPLIVVCLVCSVLQSVGQSVGLLSTPPTRTTGPTRTAAPSRTVGPTGTPKPTNTPRATRAPAPTHTSRPTETPVPTLTTMPSLTPDPDAPAVGSSSYPCKVGQIKGNMDSKIYHSPGQRDYDKTQENVLCFDTGAAAEAAGYRAAKR